MVTVTDKAKSKVEQLMSENELDRSYFLRVSVQGGGCSGFNFINPNASRTCGCGESFSV